MRGPRRLAAFSSRITPTFFRFCVVGGIGFLVDAGLLLVFLQLGINLIILRLCSFSVAILVTFELNRRWVFNTNTDAYWKQFLRYSSVQAGGFLLNFTVFSLLYLLLPPFFYKAVVCIGIASATALLVNFSGLRLLVFKAKPFQRDRTEDEVPG